MKEHQELKDEEALSDILTINEIDIQASANMDSCSNALVSVIFEGKGRIIYNASTGTCSTILSARGSPGCWICLDNVLLDTGTFILFSLLVLI